MTTWSLLEGTGTLKPDILTAGSGIESLSIYEDGICAVNSGTSVSASIISSSIALVLSALDPEDRKHV